jgi:FkbM family methyltransferase
MGLLDWILSPFRSGDGTRVHKFKVEGIPLTVVDRRESIAAKSVAKDLMKDGYQLKEIEFKPGDVVVDIGGHIGLFATYLAKKHPGIKIYSFEPIPPNFEAFQENLRLNGVTNVQVFNQAVTKDRRELEMIVHFQNSGGATGHLRDMTLPGHAHFKVPSLTLDDIFEKFGITKCKLLKIDCEGSEYEILMNTKMLDRVEHLRGEFHINSNLEGQGYSIEGLFQHCSKSIRPEQIRYVPCKMAE